MQYTGNFLHLRIFMFSPVILRSIQVIFYVYRQKNYKNEQRLKMHTNSKWVTHVHGTSTHTFRYITLDTCITTMHSHPTNTTTVFHFTPLVWLMKKMCFWKATIRSADLLRKQAALRVSSSMISVSNAPQSSHTLMAPSLLWKHEPEAEPDQNMQHVISMIIMKRNNICCGRLQFWVHWHSPHSKL